MALFGKKSPCAICGGKVSALFPRKLDGQYLCNICHGDVDLPDGVENGMTMDDFRTYRAFREENSRLKEDFVATKSFDFGLFDTKIVIDIPKQRICFNKHLEATIFEGRHIQDFVIKEDSTPLFSGNADGLSIYPSTVPQRACAMSGKISQYRMRKDYYHRQKKDDPNLVEPYFNLPEPFRSFNLEIRFQDHPYWQEFKADMTGPTFDNDRPDLDDYLRRYKENAEIMQDLARSLMELAFPGAGDQKIPGQGSTIGSNIDPVAEIMKYKSLLDQGILTQTEFDAKKRQLLGI